MAEIKFNDEIVDSEVTEVHIVKTNPNIYKGGFGKDPSIKPSDAGKFYMTIVHTITDKTGKVLAKRGQHVTEYTPNKDKDVITQADEALIDKYTKLSKAKKEVEETPKIQQPI